MKYLFSSKSLTVFIGVSACGLTGYLLYLLYRNNEEDDDYLDVFPSKSSYKTVEVEVPKDIVRTLIGRNGANIKQLQVESGTRINFKEPEKDKNYRVCLVRGSHQNCGVATVLIQEFIANQPVLECEIMVVPQRAVGKIIGRCGDQICEIRDRTGAQITIPDKDRTKPTTQVILKGASDQVRLAKMLIEDIVERCQVADSNINAKLSKREPRVSPKLSAKQVPGVEQISSVSGQSDAQFEVYVSAMVNPSRFWLQIVGPKATELDQLVEEMTVYYNNESNKELHRLNSVGQGDVVASTFNFDKKWYRAEVLRVIDNNAVELYYLDYGDTDKVDCKELFELRTDFLTLHFQAIECYLARVDPVGEEWSDRASDCFEELTHVAQWKKLSARMNGYCVREKTRAKRAGSPVPGVELFCVNNGEDVDVADELVRNGLAQYRTEPERSSPSMGSSRSGSNDVDVAPPE